MASTKSKLPMFSFNARDIQMLSLANAIKNMFLKLCDIHAKISVLGSLFNKVAEIQACNFIKKWLQHRVFSVNVAKFLRIDFL